MQRRKVGELSQKEMILIAALHLETIMTLEELTIKCWEMFPKAFGLKGFEESQSDRHRLMGCLYGSKGLIGTRHMEAIDPDETNTRHKERVAELRLTAFGANVARTIAQKLKDKTLNKTVIKELNPDERILLDVVSSEAFRKYTTGQRDSITHQDVEKFFKIDTKKNLELNQKKIEDFRKIQIRIFRTMVDPGPLTIGDQTVAEVTVNNIQHCVDYLCERFKSILNGISYLGHKGSGD